ncbi:hypothetical protein [Chryseobacterium luquanense]|uniref:DUF4369 domain-containing protein n=1 Tax=Chryseobacterium luquanense TaxID=2983766 RepID=A0ABT3Y7H5_9FLAO|nr:hypothetical protein [Chryseobacterium luquanense]MCX8534114.1 hypothetical protein [Chryseobacterium luquanense]
MKILIYFLLLFFGLQSCKSQVLYFEAENTKKNKDGTPIDYFTLEYHKDTGRTIFRISKHAEEYGSGSNYIYMDTSLHGQYIYIYHQILSDGTPLYTDGLYYLPVELNAFKKLYYSGTIKKKWDSGEEYVYKKELKEMDDNQQELYFNALEYRYKFKKDIKKAIEEESESFEGTPDSWWALEDINTPDTLRRVKEIDYNKFPKLFRDKYDLKKLKEQIEKKEEERRIQSEKESKEWQRKNREKALLENNK